MTVAVSPYLERSVPFEVTRSSENGDGLTFEGYAAVFGSVTRIDSWEGTFDEQIAPGAFRKTIKERTPVLQFDHGRHAVVGSIPIGAIRELREDDKGLFVQARLSNNWLVEPVREAIANGSISGMSFRFETVKDEWVDNKGVRITDPEELRKLLWNPGERGPLSRTLREVRMPELGPVVFPAYPDTSASVRSRTYADAITSNAELRRIVQASLVGARVDADPKFEGADLAELARALLFGERPENEARTDSPGDYVRQDDSDMIATSEVGDESIETVDPASDGATVETDEPLPEHSDTESAVEPPLGHSEPDAETPDEAPRSTTPTGPTFLQMALAEEELASRQHRAAHFRAMLADASAKTERYSNA